MVSYCVKKNILIHLELQLINNTVCFGFYKFKQSLIPKKRYNLNWHSLHTFFPLRFAHQACKYFFTCFWSRNLIRQIRWSRKPFKVKQNPFSASQKKDIKNMLDCLFVSYFCDLLISFFVVRGKYCFSFYFSLKTS